MADLFADIRGQARIRASMTLRDNGFPAQSDGSFAGELVDGAQRIAVRIVLPSRFPDVPPTISMNDPSVVSRRSHIEQDGKLCLYPYTGLLIDTSRPEQVVLDSLQRATSILFGTEQDYRAEFLAYWSQPYDPHLLSIVSDLNHPHPLAASETESRFLVVGDDRRHLDEWLGRVGWNGARSRHAFLVPLRELPEAPSFGSFSDHGDLLAILNRHAKDEDRVAFEAWMKAAGLPALLILSAPAVRGAGRVVFAAELRRAKGKAADRIHKGFRPGKMPTALEVARSRDEPAIRIEPHRADAEYVVSRVGGDVKLKACSVVIIGCGALGSQIAVNLAATGVGQLTLIDRELLSVDNVHRHAIGMSCVGEYKTNALRDHLLARFPHLSIRSIPEDVETALANRPETFNGQNLIMLATGDETLERRLNTFVSPSVRRIHGWLEPLGVGGHALLTGPSACFNCVFDRDEAGLYNLASLVRRGQDFLRTIDGCASTFTPFGFIDAAQGAVEVARLALEVLRDEHALPRIVSWVGNLHEFQVAGYELSRRAAHVLAQGRIVENAYGRRDCEVCRGR